MTSKEKKIWNALRDDVTRPTTKTVYSDYQNNMIAIIVVSNFE